MAATGHEVSQIQKKRVLIRALLSDFAVAGQVIKLTSKTYDQDTAELFVLESIMEKLSDQTALVTRGKKNAYNCKYCGRRGHTADRCYHNQKRKTNKKKLKRPNRTGQCKKGESSNERDSEKVESEKQNKWGTSMLVTPTQKIDYSKQSNSIATRIWHSPPTSKWFIGSG